VSSVIYVIYSESVFNDAVSVEIVGNEWFPTYNAALSALDDIAGEFDIRLEEDESSFFVRSGGSTVEYYIDTLTEG
jgi:hypothetical protein